MLTRGIEVMQYIRASAGRAGLQVVFEDSNQPRHDGKTIYLPKITTATTEAQMKMYMASTDHEVAHDRFSSFEVLKKRAFDPQSLLFFVWNFLEDSRVNNIEANEYRGFRENWDDSTSELMSQIVDRCKASPDTLMSKLVLALMKWEGHIIRDLFPQIEHVASQIEAEKILDVLNNFSDRLVDCHGILDKTLGTEATAQLAYDILTALGKDCKEELEKAAAKARAEAAAKGKPSKDKSTTTAKGKKAADKAGEEAGDGSKEKDDSDEFKIVKIKLTEEDLKKYSVSSPDEGKEWGKIGINYDPVCITRGEWSMTDYDKFEVVNYPKGTAPRSNYLSVDRSSFLHYYRERVVPKMIAQENFAQQVRRLIQIRARAQTQYGVKKGKLDQSRLSRIGLKVPGFSDRIFKNRIENTTLDAAVTVLVDMSGSMHGDKSLFALGATSLLNEVLPVIGVPCEILGFTDSHYTEMPLMFIYKAFSDLKITNDVLQDYFAKSTPWMHGNPDGENILWAHDRLMKRKEKRKLLIVLSDGEPAASRGITGLEKFTKVVIEEIEKSKKVDIYGLGLCNHAVTEYYKANSVVTRPEEIPGKLLTLIERKILNA